MADDQKDSLSVYDFEDYRLFLDAWLNEKKARSIRSFASKLGVSHSYVSMVRSGRRNLKVEHARHWAIGMRQDEFEQDYFEAMVRAKHGATDDQRRIAQRQVDAARAWRLAITQEIVLRAWSNWYVLATIELAKCRGFQADAQWISDHMMPSITIEQAAEALELLDRLGILVETDAGVEVIDVPGSTGKTVADAALRTILIRSHKAWLSQAGHALENLPHTERYLGAVTFSLDSERFTDVLDVVHRVQIEAAEAAETKKGEKADRVYTLGVALIPRSKSTLDPGDTQDN